MTTLRSNCRLGIHDGPKVAMPGDRLVNDAGISLRRWGRSTVRNIAETDGRSSNAILNLPSLDALYREINRNKDRLPVWSTWSLNPWSWVRVPPVSLFCMETVAQR
jgi:hypothetical protein